MTSEPKSGRGCLYHPALAPRIIRSPEPRHRHPKTAAIDDPSWGERATVALDVFDGSIRRAEALAAHLHRTGGYDISGISARLNALRSLRGALVLAARERPEDLPERLRPDLEHAFADLGGAFSALKQVPGDAHAAQCQTAFRNAGGARVPQRPVPALCRHAAERQHA